MVSNTLPRGSITLEIVIAFGILMTMIGGAMVAVYGIDAAAMDLKYASRARYRAEHMIYLYGKDIKKDSAYTPHEERGDGGHREEVKVRYINPFLTALHVSEMWRSGFAKDQHIDLMREYLDITRMAGIGACLPLADEVMGLEVMDEISVAVSVVPTDVEVRGGYVYLATDGNGADPDLYIIDARNARDVQIVASLNTGPGITAVTLGEEGYLYAANTSTTGQLQIIDVRDPLHPAVVLSYKLPSVVEGRGSAIRYEKDRVILGLESNGASPELYIVDVNDYSTPQVIATWEVGSTVKNITIKTPYIYLTKTGTPTQLIVLDSKDAELVEVTHFDPTGSAVSNGGTGVMLVGSHLYLSRSADIIGASSSQLIRLSTDSAQYFEQEGGVQIGKSINDMAFHSGRILLAVGGNSKTLQLWNTEDMQSPTMQLTHPLPDVPVALSCDTHMIYLAQENPAHALQILRVITE